MLAFGESEELAMNDEQIDEIVQRIKDRDGVDILHGFGGNRKLLEEYIGEYMEVLNKHIVESLMAPGNKENPMPEATEDDKKSWLEMNKGRVLFGEKV